MTRRQTKSARPKALFVAAALAALATLALAGPAAAHHRGEDHHGRHHHGKKHHRSDTRNLHGSQGEAAGTISSFDPATGRLTIALSGGDTISGLVTEDTWIENGQGCDHHDGSGDLRRLHGWDDGDGDWGDHSSGSTDDLVPGAAVDEAFLVVKDGVVTFVKVELAPSP